MAIFSNGYGEGLNKDVAKSKYKPTQYVDAQNIRIATKDGLSILAVNNVKGTEKVLADISSLTSTFPATKPSYYLALGSGPLPATTNISITTTSGVQTLPYTVTSTTTIDDVYQFIITNFIGYGTEFNVAVTDKIVIYSVVIDTNVQSSNSAAIVSDFNSYGGYKETPIGYGTIRDSIIIL